MSYARMDFVPFDPKPPGVISIIFTLHDTSGALSSVLDVFIRHGISLQHIESRPSKNFEWEHEFLVEFKTPSVQVLETVTSELEKLAKHVQIIGELPESHSKINAIPWFPRKISDLDGFAEKVLECGEELSADHPGFTDAEYRARRAEITRIARTYRTGQPIPRIEYTEREIATWRQVYESLIGMYKTHACREHQYVFPLLQQNCGYGPDSIPQLEDVSRFLKECTGFTLRPVMGLLSSRDFLNGLAFRVFHSTQYIRHHSKPDYTPEPDVCHELLGHVPLFADPEFAAFSQELGLASLGATDEDIVLLSTIYWFTIEFGLCKEGDEVRAFGAGLLSSYGELAYCLGSEPKLLPFDPAKTGQTAYPITNYQPVYFVAESFVDAQMRVREWAGKMKRPFGVRYNPYTQTIEILDTKERILRYAANIGHDMQNLVSSLRYL